MADGESVGKISGELTLDNTPFIEGLDSSGEKGSTFADQTFTPKADLDKTAFDSKTDDVKKTGEDIGSKTYTPKVDADDTLAKEKLDGVKIDLDYLKSAVATAKVDANSDAARAKVDDIKLRLDGLSEKTATPNIDLHGADSAALQLAALDEELKHVNDSSDKTAASLDRTSKSASDTGNAASSASGGMSLLVKAAIGLGPALVPIGAVAAAGLGGIVSLSTAAGAGLGALALAAGPVVSNMNTAAGAQKTFNQAVQDFGPFSYQAVSASGQLKAAMADLSPAEQAATSSLTDFKQKLQDWQQSFDPTILPLFKQGLTDVSNLLPVLSPLVNNTANALKNLLAGFDWSSLDQFIQFLSVEAGPAITDFGHIFENLGQAFANIVEAFAPVGLKVGQGLVDLTQKFSNFTATWTDTGSGFQTFISYAEREAPVVGHVLDDLGHAFVVLVEAAAPVGAALLNAFQALGSGLGSSGATGGLKTLGDDLANLVNKATPLVKVVGEDLGNAFGNLVRNLGPLLPNLETLIGDVAQLAKIGGPGFLSGFSSVFTTLAPAIVAVVKPVTDLITAFARWQPGAFGFIADLGGIAFAASRLTGPAGLALKGAQYLELGIMNLGNVAGGAVKGLQYFELGISKLGTLAWSGIVSGVSLLVSGIGKLATMAWGFIVDGLDSATGAMMGLDLSMDANPIGAVVLALTAIGVAAYEVVDHFNAIKQWFERNKALINDFLTGWTLGLNLFIEWLVDNWDHIAGDISQPFMSAFDTLSRDIPQWTADMVNFFVHLPGDIVHILSQIGNDIAEPFKGGFDTLSRDIPQWTGDMVNFFVQIPGRVMTALGQIGADIAQPFIGAFDTLSRDIPQWVGDVVSFFTQLPGRIMNAIAGLPSQLLGFGHDMLQGLINGLKDLVGDVTKAIEDIGQDIINAFKSLFGISSPSTVFQQLGRDMIQGLINGLGDMASALGSVLSGIANSIGNTIGNVVHSIGSALDLTSGGGPKGFGGAGGSGQSTNPSNNNYDLGPALAALSPPGRATGGPVAPGQPYTVGEQGPEVIVPQGAGTVVPNGQLGGATAGGGGGGAAGSPAQVAAASGYLIETWTNANGQLQGIWAHIQAQFVEFTGQHVATAQQTGQKVQASQQTVWPTILTHAQQVWSQMIGGLTAFGGQQVSNMQQVGTQTTGLNTQTWNQVHAQTQGTWQQLTALQLSTNATQLANTQQQGSQTVASTTSTLGQVHATTQSTQQTMTAQQVATNSTNLANTQQTAVQTTATAQQLGSNLATQNAQTLANTTSSTQQTAANTLGAYNGLAGQLPAVTSSMWGNVNSAYANGINGTAGSLNSFLGAVNNVGSQVGAPSIPTIPAISAPSIGGSGGFFDNIGTSLGIGVNHGTITGTPQQGAPHIAPGLASGGTFGRYESPTALVAEGGYPEYVIPTDPKYRSNAHMLLGGLLKETNGLAKMAAGGIVNPAPTLHQGRTDQGVDWSGAGPILAVAPGTILTTSNSGWPGGTFIAERLDSAAGLPSSIVYYAEDITPQVGIGQHVGAGQQIGEATGGPDGVEIGFGSATSIGTALAGQLGEFSGDNATPLGQAFLSFIGGGSPGGGGGGGGGAPVLPAIPAWNNLPTPPTLMGAPNGAANTLAAAVTSWITQQESNFASTSGGGGGAGGASGVGQGGPGSMSPAAIQALWIAQGGPASAAVNMSGIAFAESGDNPNAVQQGEPPGLTGWGLYQITPTSGIPGGPYLLDPTVNTQKAIQLFNAAGGYSPWRGDPYASSHGLAKGGVLSPFMNVPVQSFDTGGLLAPGMTLAINQTGSSERVVAGGTMGSPTVNITINGANATVDQLKMMSTQAVVDAFRQLEQEYQAT